MASFRNILAVASLFVVLSLVSSAPVTPDVELDAVGAGSTGAGGGGNSNSSNGATGIATSGAGTANANAVSANYADSALVAESIAVVQSSDCGNCEEGYAVSDTYVLSSNNAQNVEAADASATGLNPQAVAQTYGNSNTNDGGSASQSGVIDSQG